MIVVALNECCACGHQWTDRPGAFATIRDERRIPVTPCCNTAYWRWLNYGEIAK